MSSSLVLLAEWPNLALCRLPSPMAHAYTVDPEHRQGDIVLADGARLLTCTKRLYEGSRTAMIFLQGLFRLDVEGHADGVRLHVRSLTRAPMDGGPETATLRAALTFDGTP